MAFIKEEIKQALQSLGIKGRKARTEYHTRYTVKVFVDGLFIGLWDTTKSNFVA